MRYGFSSIGCPDVSLPEMAGLAAEFGLDFIELRALGGTIDLPAYFTHAGVRVPDGTEVRLVGTNLQLTTATDAEMETFLRYSDVAHKLQAPYVRVFGGGERGDSLSDAVLDQAANVVQRCRTALQNRKLSCEMLLETHSAFCSSAHCVKLNERLDEPIKILWDSHHTWRTAGESPQETWRQLGPLIRHIHFSDSRAKIPEPGHQPYDCVLPGTGEYPVVELRKLLAGIGYAYTVSLEWEKLWHPHLPDVRQALERFVKIMK